MDSALILRMNDDAGISMSQGEIDHLLGASELVNKLTEDFQEKPLYAVWRLLALAEIPYTENLEYTRQVIKYITHHLSTQSGFALSGKAAELLPCYNAMVLEAFSRLGYAKTEPVLNALNWIKKYQPFERNAISSWDGTGTKKYGGCLKETPCYIGIAKTVKALAHYSQAIHHADPEVTAAIEKGVRYLRDHELYKRLTNREPITKHIMDIAFPASYQLNIVELLEIAYLTGNIHKDQCKDAIAFINGKRTKEGFWKINYAYKADGYVSFDKKGMKGDWVTYILNRFLSGIE